MFYKIIDFVVVVLEIFCCQMFFETFHDGKKEFPRQRGKMKAIVLLSILCYVAANILRHRFWIKIIVMYMLIVFIEILFMGISCKKSAVLGFLFGGMLFVVEYISYMFVNILVPDMENMTASQEYMGRAVAIVDQFFLFLCMIFIQRIFKTHKDGMVFDNGWGKYVLFPVTTMAMLSATVSAFRQEEDMHQIQVLCGVGLGLVVLNFFMFYLLEDAIRKSETIREKEMNELQSRNQLELYSKLTETFERQRAEAHEFKNHLMCIQSLAEQERHVELKEYIETINGEMKEDEVAIDTNNVVINAVVNAKYREAVRNHIVVVFRVNDLSEVPLKDGDLVILLSNLFNNAIEASVKHKGDRVIQFKFIKEYGDIILSMKNNYSGTLIPKGEGFLTTKENGIHGAGIKNIIQVINKYHGTYDISTDNNEFFFSAFIQEE